MEKHIEIKKKLQRSCPDLLRFVCLLGVLFCFPACNLFGPANKTASSADSAAKPGPGATPHINLAKPLTISGKAEDLALAKKIDRIINESEFSNARWGIFVVSLKDGRVLAARDARRLFNPASIQKILTAVVALDRLGADFRWQTSVFANQEIKNGVLEGDLYLYGRGAPDFDDRALGELVRQLRQRGLREIRGDVVGDESYFKGDNLGDGWTWNAAQWYYGAASSALSLNQNQARVTLRNGKPRSETKFVELSGEVSPIEDIEAVGVKRELGTNKVYVWGQGESLNVRIAVSQPALLSAKIFREMLEKNGISVTGTARSADWKSPRRLDTGRAGELAAVQSRPLSEIIRRMNRDSVNLYAELILRTLGKRFGSEAPDENPKMQKLRGDDAAGAAVVKKWLTENDVATEEIRVHDGSGLSRLDFVTPEAVGRALIYAAQSEFADTFKASLPVAGRSGTLKGRLGGVAGKVLAKTGSITYVNTLAGYAEASADETLAFVIICNNETRKAESSLIIDRIALALIDFGF